MKISKRRLDALIAAASRGIDEAEDELDHIADEDRAEKRREIEAAYEGLDYLIAWRSEMDQPKQKKPRLSKEEMVAIALNQIEDRLASPGIREIAEG
jgi:hypothetical protein